MKQKLLQFQPLKELSTVHAPSIKLKMKTLLIQFYLWPHPMVSSLQPPFLNGNAAVSQFLKAVSASVNHYCIALCKTPDLTQLNAIACYWMNCAVWSSNLCNYFLFFSLAAEHLLRTDPVEDKEGFFIALFVKKGSEKELRGTKWKPETCWISFKW